MDAIIIFLGSIFPTVRKCLSYSSSYAVGIGKKSLALLHFMSKFGCQPTVEPWLDHHKSTSPRVGEGGHHVKNSKTNSTQPRLNTERARRARKEPSHYRRRMERRRESRDVNRHLLRRDNRQSHRTRRDGVPVAIQLCRQ